METQQELQQDELVDQPSLKSDPDSISDFDSLAQKNIDDGGWIQFMLFFRPRTALMLDRFRKDGAASSRAIGRYLVIPYVRSCSISL